MALQALKDLFNLKLWNLSRNPWNLSNFVKISKSVRLFGELVTPRASWHLEVDNADMFTREVLGHVLVVKHVLDCVLVANRVNSGFGRADWCVKMMQEESRGSWRWGVTGKLMLVPAEMEGLICSVEVIRCDGLEVMELWFVVGQAAAVLTGV